MQSYKSPFFILGNPRSGTTLLRLMLNSHSRIIVPPESGFMQWWHSKYQGVSEEDLMNGSILNSIIKDVLSSKKIESWGIEFNDLYDITIENKPKNYAEFCLSVYGLYGRKQNKIDAFIGDKNNYYIHHLDTIGKIYPNAKYIHLVRDGRDVACSYIDIDKLVTTSIYKPILSQNVDDIAIEWKNNINKIDKFLSDKDSINLRYEDLITKSESTLIYVSDFLGVKYSNKMLNYYQEIFYDEPKSTFDWKTKTKQKIDSANLNKYSIVFTKEQLVSFNQIAGSELKEYGYL